jgi:membrane associated rhomboid family serine protease
METTVGRSLVVLMATGAATLVALTLGYVAHYDFGLSRQEIRTSAAIAAAIIGLLLAAAYFRKKLGKPK